MKRPNEPDYDRELRHARYWNNIAGGVWFLVLAAALLYAAVRFAP